MKPNLYEDRRAQSPSPVKGGAGALMKEFVLVQGFSGGYRSREDVTALPPGIMVKGSQNVLTNTHKRVGIRKGYTLDGQSDAVPAPVESSFDFEVHTGQTRNLRSGSNSTGTNGKLQVRYVASAGDQWNGHVFTEGQVYYIDLMTGLSLSNFNFADFWDATNLNSDLLFVNTSPSVFGWSGGIATFASASNAAGVIQGFNQIPTNGGSGYAVNDVVTISGGVGATAKVDSIVFGAIDTVNPVPASGGTGYSTGDIITVTGTGGQGGTVKAVTVAVGGVVTAISLVSQGRLYATGTNLATSGGMGTGLAIDITSVSNRAVSLLTLIDVGTGYSAGTGIATTGGTGTGLTVEITQTATGYIKKTGTKTWAEEGFYTASGSRVTVNGTDEYEYTGNGDTLYLTGITGDPTIPGYAAGTVINQTVRTTPNTSILGIPPNFKNNIIAVLDNRVYLGGVADNTFFISKTNSFTDYTFTLPVATVGDGAKITLDAVPVAFQPQETKMYVSAGKNLWYQTAFTLSADLTHESYSVTRLKTTALQGAQSQAWTTKVKNDIAFLSFEPIVNAFGLVEDINSYPQMTDLSYSIVDDINGYDATGGSAFYHKQFLYLAYPRENLVRIYNMTDPKKPYWEAPQILPVSRFSVVDGELYGHSSQVTETYRLFDGYTDNGKAVSAVAKFSYDAHGSRFCSKSFNEHFQDGYISSNTTLNLQFDYWMDRGTSMTSFPIVGTDARYVFIPPSTSSLGKVPLGKNPLGGEDAIDSDPLPPYFHLIRTFPRVPFYFQSTSFSSYGIGQQWEIISFGPAVSATSEGNNSITI